MSVIIVIVEQDKENDSRNAQATQAAINRRRKPKRRSTGVVQVDMDVSVVCCSVKPNFLRLGNFRPIRKRFYF